MAFHVQINVFIRQGAKNGGYGMHFWSNSGDFGEVVTAATSLAGKIEKTLSNHARVTSGRITRDGAFRDVRAIKDFGVTSGSRSGWDGDRATAALQLIHKSAGPYTTLQWLRGVPDDVVSEGCKYTPDKVPGYANALAALIAELKAPSNGWCQRKLTLTNQNKVLESFNVATGVFVAKGISDAAVGAIRQFRIKGVRVPVGLNDLWEARREANDAWTLIGYVPPADVNLVAFIKGAKLREQLRSYVKIEDSERGDVTSHYTGRPTDLLGGRRHRRRRSRAGQRVEV